MRPNGYSVDRATVRQRKTGRPVKFELADQTCQAVDEYIKAAGKKPRKFLFAGRRTNNQCMTTRQYARLLSEWVAGIGLDPKLFWHAFSTPDEGDSDGEKACPVIRLRTQNTSRTNPLGKPIQFRSIPF